MCMCFKLLRVFMRLVLMMFFVDSLHIFLNLNAKPNHTPAIIVELDNIVVVGMLLCVDDHVE